MSDPGRTPVLVGVGALTQRESDPARAFEPSALMARALERAADDAGSRRWLERADSVLVPRGFWDYADPGRLVADAVGAKRARTGLAEIGVLQTSLFARAAEAIASGAADVVLVTGGEAKHRAQQAERAGGEATYTSDAGAEPDEVWRPAEDILHPLELASQLYLPVRQYAVIENALRAAEGQGLDAHRDAVARLWSGMSEVAAANPDAWSRERVAPERIRDAGDGNRMLAFPYTKLHNSQWNVDQAAGLIVASAAAARAAGVPESQWVLPRAVAESNRMLTLVERADLHRCPAFGIAARRALERAGLGVDDLTHLELYSCFPVAVRVQQREIGIPPERPVTVTGGMAFAGGPLNNFVLQAAVALARRLRGEPGAAGMLNAVSGMLTKQGVSLWSSAPGPAFGFDEVGDEAARATPTVTPLEDFRGSARIAGYTVLYGDAGPGDVVVLADAPDGGRAVAVGSEPAWAEDATRREWVGREAEIASGRLLRVH